MFHREGLFRSSDAVHLRPNVSDCTMVVPSATKGKELRTLVLHSRDWSLEEERLQLSVQKYGSAAEVFILNQWEVSLVGYCGGLAEAGDVIVSFCTELITCVGLEQDVYHVPVCLQHFRSIGIHRHRACRGCEKQKRLRLPF